MIVVQPDIVQHHQRKLEPFPPDQVEKESGLPNN